MDTKPHDTFAKIVLGKLARGREVTVEAELPARVYADVLVRPGPPLPSWSGLLGRVLETGLTVVEVYHGRPRDVELCHAQAKGALALGAELSRGGGRVDASTTRVLLLTIGTPRRAMKRCFPGRWVEVQRGYRCHSGLQRFVHLDLLRLEVSSDTAWAHVVGGSPYLDEAVGLLLMSGEGEARQVLYEMMEEVRIMPELQQHGPDGVEGSSAFRFAKAWELALSRQEGRREGRLEGRREGRREGLELGWRYGKLQALESLLGLPETPLETLSTLSSQELDRRIAELTRRARDRVS